MAQRLIIPGRRILQFRRGFSGVAFDTSTPGVFFDIGVSVVLTPISPASVIRIYGTVEGAYCGGGNPSMRYQVLRNNTVIKNFGYPSGYVAGALVGGSANAPFSTQDQPGVAGQSLTYRLRAMLVAGAGAGIGFGVQNPDPATGLQSISEMFIEELL